MEPKRGRFAAEVEANTPQRPHARAWFRTRAIPLALLALAVAIVLAATVLPVRAQENAASTAIDLQPRILTYV